MQGSGQAMSQRRLSRSVARADVKYPFRAKRLEQGKLPEKILAKSLETG